MINTRCFSIESPYPDKQMTLYVDDAVETKAALIYFHGGGLLYGRREDLPETHIAAFTAAGYAIFSYDYPLAPVSKLDVILEDVISSVNDCIGHLGDYLHLQRDSLSYVLWGRSAGAYLCLIAAASGRLAKAPAGILSYYGYGLLTDSWADAPSAYFNKLPKVPESCLDLIPEEPHCDGDLNTHYSVYVYARQSGLWMNLVYEGKLKYLYRDFTLRLADRLPCPLFCAHCIGDTDVPFAEFQALCDKYAPTRFIAAGSQHDFDRDTDSEQTAKLLRESIAFLDHANRGQT